MKTRISHASNTNGSLATPALASECGRSPIPLTERELEMVAAAGGGAGINPSAHRSIVIPN
jgi:hypothetical protein